MIRQRIHRGIANRGIAKCKKRLSLCHLIFPYLIFPYSYVFASEPGTTALNFLKLEVGARQAGMGGGSVGLADDINAARHNPAALARLEKPEAAFLYSNYFMDVSYKNLAMSM